MSRRRALTWLFSGLAAALLAATAASQSTRAAGPGQQATIEVIDVGQGDAIFVRSPEGKTALIDAGPSNSVVDSLKAMGVTSLDLVVVSHHHSDHYGGMRKVIETFQPKYFLASDSKHTTSSYLRLLTTVKDRDIQAIYPLSKKPRRIELGSLVLTLFPQPPANDDEENENSIGIRLSYGDFAMILTGDSEERARAYWVKTCPELLADATVLKLAHHGSRNGTDAKWLDLIDPELTVASLADGNSYGHPHSETVTLLKSRHLEFLRTDRDGSIKITTDGKRWRIVKEQLARRTDDARKRR